MFFRWWILFISTLVWTASARVLPRPRNKHRGNMRMPDLSPIRVNSELHIRGQNPNMNIRRGGPLASLLLKGIPNNPNMHLIKTNDERILKKLNSLQVPIEAIDLNQGLSEENIEKPIFILKASDITSNKKRNTNQLFQNSYEPIVRFEQLDQDTETKVNINDIVNDLIKAVRLEQTKVNNRPEKRAKDSGSGIFNKNGMYYVTHPKDRGINLNDLINKVIKYHRNSAQRSKVAPSKVFNPTEAKRIKTIARAIDEEDRYFEEMNQDVEDLSRQEHEEEAAEQERIQDALIGQISNQQVQSVEVQNKNIARELEQEQNDMNIDLDQLVVDFNQLVA